MKQRRSVITVVIIAMVIGAFVIYATALRMRYSALREAPRAQAMVSDTRPVLRGDAVVFPVMYDGPNWRMNLSINTAPPSEAWSNPQWRALHRVRPDGTFPVRIWRIRAGNTTPTGVPLPDVMTMQVAMIRASFPTNLSVPLDARFKRGDLVAVEYVPGLLVTEQWPILSVIDNRSGAPTTVFPIRTRVPLTGNCYESSAAERCGS